METASSGKATGQGTRARPQHGHEERNTLSKVLVSLQVSRSLSWQEGGGKEHRPLARDQSVQFKDINLIVCGSRRACSCWLQEGWTVRKHGVNAARIKPER